MKKLSLAIIMLAIALLTWWFGFRTPPHDLHYDAAACVALDVLGTPTSEQDFVEKIRTVIVNENNSYSFKQVSYDDQQGQMSIAKYRALSAEQKATAAKDVDSCIRVISASH